MNYLNKIHILLPYKENFYNNYFGAVSLYVKEFLENSKYKNSTYVVGLKNQGIPLFKNFININKSFLPVQSKTKSYLNSYMSIIKENNPKIIEIHNRPSYVNILFPHVISKLVLFFHNNPLEMLDSKTINERINLLNKCEMIIFNSIYIKNCFFKNLNENLYKFKYKIIYNSSKKLGYFPRKKKLITYVGKLNHAKGYDIYVSALKEILNKFPDYKAIAVGDEKRRKIYFNHVRFKELGFIKNSKVINTLKKTDIAIIPSRWNEPFGRTALEASKCGCYTICSDVGGLRETTDTAIFIKNINYRKLIKEISYAIKNKKNKKKIQLISYNNIKHNLISNTKLLDHIRENFLSNNNNNNNNKKILNIYNLGIKLFHRLYNISIGRKLTIGFIKNGYDVLEISDRDFNRFFLENSSFKKYLLKTINNYQPKILFFGHSKLLNIELLTEIKRNYPHLIICEWNEDFLGFGGPDNFKNFNSLKIKEKLINYFFVTTNPRFLLGKLKNSFYFPVPVDRNIETEKQFRKKGIYDLFFTLSHGVNRGVLKKNKIDERDHILRSIVKNKLINCNFFGFNSREPIWADKFYDEIKKCNMGLNLSRGKPVNLYSSNRIASYIGNGLLTFIDVKTGFKKIFKNNEVIFYNNIKDLIKKIIFYKKNDNLRKKNGN